MVVAVDEEEGKEEDVEADDAEGSVEELEDAGTEAEGISTPPGGTLCLSYRHPLECVCGGVGVPSLFFFSFVMSC